MNLNDRVAYLIENAVGLPLRVRLSPALSCVGVIKTAKFHKWRMTKAQRFAQFEVLMMCGEKGLERTFVLERLPTKKLKDKAGKPAFAEIKAVDYKNCEGVPF